jgi:uncharacterized protein (TIGR03435 family)
LGPPRGGPGSQDPTHITWGATLAQVLQTAYDIRAYQVEGPDWLNSERYDFSVVVPEEATRAQVAVMWRNLLASRFGLKSHTIQKEFSVDDLVVGPQGHKLKVNTEPIPEPSAEPNRPPPPPPPPPGPGGEFKPPAMTGPGLMMMMRFGPGGVVAQATGRAQPVSALVQMVSNQIGHPVVDKTGLTGRYDFNLEFAPSNNDRGPLGAMRGIVGAGPSQAAGANPGAGPAPTATEVGIDLAGAMQQQLGLRLVKGKGMLDVVVVDRADKVPTEN